MNNVARHHQPADWNRPPPAASAGLGHEESFWSLCPGAQLMHRPLTLAHLIGQPMGEYGYSLHSVRKDDGRHLVILITGKRQGRVYFHHDGVTDFAANFNVELGGGYILQHYSGISRGEDGHYMELTFLDNSRGMWDDELKRAGIDPAVPADGGPDSPEVQGVPSSSVML